ncbi:peptidylprolyl isomerase [Ramlibacter rhizophilus]|uniref:Chaperone SurA n=1 Tax=Ramlibacter rhizophilus TaxID=1781167 RepID=A0A4Z0BIH3_9BURK|nr:peptidylprolyl isomerase [Ramlibacter rhizophilus]TFY97934.1 molecular chaperone SurA [Ramlibacter rhizophilus]
MIAGDSPRLRAFALSLAALAATAGPVMPAAAQLGLGTPGMPPSTEAPRARGNEPRPADHIVAVVNSEPITFNELRAREARVAQELELMGRRPPSGAELRGQVLEQLIGERAQLQIAKELGLRVDDALVDTAEQNIARQNRIDVEELRRRLASEGISQQSFRQDLRNQVLLSRLRQREIEPRVKVTEPEVEQFIREQQNPQDPSAIELNLAHILVAVPENAAPSLVQELRQKADRIRARASAGEDFSALAREVSDAPGAASSGGVVGLRTADRYPPLFVQATRQLAPGALSEVVRSGAGFHVIKVLEKRQGVLPGATVTQHRARHILLRPGGGLTEAEARKRLEGYKKQVESGQASFAQLAQAHSQDASAREGGDLGWAGPGMFVPEFEDALAALSPGQIAEPVESRFGLHLIQLVDRRQHTLSAREQREIARNLLREKKMQEEYQRWAKEVRGRAFVDIREPVQ